MLTVFYIIGCTSMFLLCLWMFTEPGPKDNKEAIITSAWTLCLVVFWPIMVVIVCLATLFKWIAGSYDN